ncbi:MAG: ATP-grasp domain-containing protein [Deltaproteobacteria bacterium]|nr:ATP-grasp domain-containing protein [Deltaproteobacteria bacterium]
MQKRTILFVAGSIETVPAVKLANEMGLHTVVSDGNPNAACFDIADDRIVADTYNVSQSLQQAMAYHRTVRPIDGVICVASDVPLTVATIAQALGLQGISVTAAKLASDKLAMKERFVRDGVRVPWFTQVHSAASLKEVVAQKEILLIIKPVDSRGARGVIRLLRNVDLDWAYQQARAHSPTGRVMVEEFIEGPQVSTETLMLNGWAHTPGFSDRNYSLLEKYAPFVIEDGGDLPSNLPAEVQDKIRTLVQKAAISMGVVHGVVKGDIVVRDGEPMVIELAARLSGGYFCTHEIPMNTGVDLLGAAIRVALNEVVAPEELTPRFMKCISQRYLFPKEGRVVAIEGVASVSKRPGMEFVEIKVKPGDIIGKMESHPARAGLVIASGDTRAQAMERAAQAVQDIVVKVE